MRESADRADVGIGTRSSWTRVTLGFLIVSVIIVCLLYAAFLVVTRVPADQVFRGKLESKWIESVGYFDETQVKQWREFGPDGVQVLVRGLERAGRPRERIYRKFFHRLSGIAPIAIMKMLPIPKPDSTRATRMNIISLLVGLQDLALPAAPEMYRELDDEANGVRELAISFFTGSEDDRAPLNRIPAAEKRKILPLFVRAAQDKSEWGLRNNALGALGYYSEESGAVIPVLVEALGDAQVNVRMRAAEALFKVAPGEMKGDEAYAVVLDILKDPDDQVAWRAAALLGKMKLRPQSSVNALIECLDRKSSVVAVTAVQSLGKFPEEAELTIPALRKAKRSTNRILAGWAERALKALDPAAANAAKHR